MSPLQRASSSTFAFALLATILTAPSSAQTAQTDGRDATESPERAVVRSEPNGFSIRHETISAASPESLYSALTEDVSDWWDPSHTYSGEAANLSIDARPMGCFCESLPGGGVVHMTVVYASPPSSLRLSGGLGPLQAAGVSGTMTWSFEPTEDGTLARLVYNVSGSVEGGLEPWAPIVAEVLGVQFRRLVAYVAAP